MRTHLVKTTILAVLAATAIGLGSLVWAQQQQADVQLMEGDTLTIDCSTQIQVSFDDEAHASVTCAPLSQ